MNTNKLIALGILIHMKFLINKPLPNPFIFEVFKEKNQTASLSVP